MLRADAMKVLTVSYGNIANGISQPLQFLIVKTMQSRVYHQMLGIIHPGKEL
jgi:hypothetical protein